MCMIIVVVIPQSHNSERVDAVILEHRVSGDARTQHMFLSVRVCIGHRTLEVQRLELAAPMPLSATVITLQFMQMFA